MDFISHSYLIMRRASGKFGLASKRYNGVWYTTDEGKVKVFATYGEAKNFYAAKKAECMEQRKAKKAAKEETEKIVEEFKNREEIKALLDAFCHDNGDGTCSIKRNFKMASGKAACIEWNNGLTKRSLACVSLYVAGEGCLFTSGTIDTVMHYIATH